MFFGGIILLLTIVALWEISQCSKLPPDINYVHGGTSKRALTEEDKDMLLSLTNSMSRQTMLQQLFVEERIRSDGSSGIKQNRLTSQGSKPYHANTFNGARVAAMHTHKNNIRTIGMGEFAAVLNGVEFRTRHNDYGLRMPSTTSNKYNQKEDVPFPDVPTSVLEKETLDEQVSKFQNF